jgi:hypothetical protein
LKEEIAKEVLKKLKAMSLEELRSRVLETPPDPLYYSILRLYSSLNEKEG